MTTITMAIEINASKKSPKYVSASQEFVPCETEFLKDISDDRLSNKEDQMLTELLDTYKNPFSVFHIFFFLL